MSFELRAQLKSDGHFSELKFSVNHFFQTFSSVSTWLSDLLTGLSFFRNLSFELFPCQRGGIIEIGINLATPFLCFF
ncbi:hypothetical protein DA100_15240 [Vibrio sp. Hep-1b-8]|nr:hypothetical protein DA100_15240 [Vibrio sp. Hep-1b-8]